MACWLQDSCIFLCGDVDIFEESKATHNAGGNSLYVFFHYRVLKM